MFRLFFLGLLVVMTIFFTALSVWVVFITVRWIKKLLTAGNTYLGQQREQWERRQAEKDLPDYLVDGIRALERIEGLTLKVTTRWQLLLKPILRETRQVVNLAAERPAQAEIARSFFTVTLGAMEGFVSALATDQKLMTDKEEEKARQSLEVLQVDVGKYRDKLESKRRFELQVMMEVMKQRFKSKN